MAQIVRALGQMPQVIDDASADKRAPFAVESDSPRVAGPLAKEFELLRPRMDSEQSAGEIEFAAILFDDRSIEDTVKTIEITVRTPRESVREFVRIVPTEPGDDHGRFVSDIIAVGVLEKKDIGRIGHPDAAVTDGDAGGNVEAFGKDFDAIDPAIAIGVFEDLDPIATWARFLTWVLKAFGDVDPTGIVERHRDRVEDVGLARHQLDPKTFGDLHLGQRFRRRKRRSRWLALPTRNELLLGVCPVHETNRTG